MLELELAATFKMTPFEKLESALYLYTFKEDVKKDARKMYLKKALLHPVVEEELGVYIKEQITKLGSGGSVKQKHLQKLLDNYKQMGIEYERLSVDLQEKRNRLSSLKKGIE